MLINKKRYEISRDKKLLHKVGKQWVVVSAFVLTLLGAKGAKTAIHASTTSSASDQIANQLNQHLQQNQKLVNNQAQSASQHPQSSQPTSAVQSQAGSNQSQSNNIIRSAHQLHAVIMNHNLKNAPVASTQQRIPSQSVAPKSSNQQSSNQRAVNSLGQSDSNPVVNEAAKVHSSVTNDNQSQNVKPVKKLLGAFTGKPVYLNGNPNPIGYIYAGPSDTGIAYPEEGSGGGQWALYYKPGTTDSPAAQFQGNEFDNYGDIVSSDVPYAEYGIGDWSDADKGIYYTKMYKGNDGSVWVYGTIYSALFNNHYSGWIDTKHTFVLDNGDDTYLSLNNPGANQSAQTHDLIVYMYRGQKEGSYEDPGVQGGPGEANGTNLNPGFEVADDGSQSFTFDGNTHYVNVKPAEQINVVDYMYQGRVISSSFTPLGEQGASSSGINWYDYGTVQMPANWNIANDGTQNFTFGPAGTIQHVNIVPNRATDTINYVYNGATLHTQSFTGNSVNASGDSNYNFDAGGYIPANYHATSGTGFNYDGGTHTVYLAPNTVYEHVDYDWYGSSKGSTTLSGPYGTTGVVNGQGLAPGWHFNGIYGGNSNGQFTFTPNGNITCGVAPNTVNDTLNYLYNGQYKGSGNFNGNDYRTGVNGTFTPGSYPSGIPANYHVINPNQSFNYDSGTHDVAITPNYVTDTIQYQYNGSTLGSHQFTGSDVYANGANNAGFDINGGNQPGIPANYHLVNSQYFNYDGGTHGIAIAPNQVTDTVNYQLNGQTLGSHQFTGSDVYANGANNTSFNVNSGNQPGIPANYHLINSATFNYDGSTHNIAIAPNQMTDTVNYVYKDHNKIISSSFHPVGPFNVANSINWYNYGYDQMPGNWNIANDGTQSFVYNGGTHNVNIVPNRSTDTLQYMDGSTWRGSSNQFTGNNSGANGASDTSFQPGTNPNGLPYGYSMANPWQWIPYDGGTHQIAVTPNPMTKHINYVWYNRNVGTGTMTGPYQRTATANGSGLEPGWHVNPAGGSIFTYDDGTTSAEVLPNTVTDHIHYTGDGANFWQAMTGNDYRTGVNGTFNIDGGNHPSLPAHYHLNGNHTFNYDGGNHDVPVTRDTSTQHFNYMWFNSNEGSTDMTLRYGLSGTVDGNGLNPGWHMLHIDGTNSLGFTYNDGTQRVDIAPNVVTSTVDYMYHNQVKSSHQFTGNDYRTGVNGTFKINSHSLGMPANYHVVNNQTFNYNSGQTYKVNILPNKVTDKIKFVVPSNLTHPGYRGKVGQIASDDTDYTGNDVYANGSSDHSFTPSDNMDGLPNGYHVLPNQTIDYNGQNDVVKIFGNQETVPVAFIDQNGNRVGNLDTNIHGVMDSDVTLPTKAPFGYTMNDDQSRDHPIYYQEVMPINQSEIYPVIMHVTGQAANVRVQYKKVNGQNVGNVVTIPGQLVGNDTNLTQKGLPANYTLVGGQNSATDYTLRSNDLVGPDYKSTRIFPIYVAPLIQKLTINYFDPKHDLFLDSRSRMINNNTQIYLTNNDITDNSGNNADNSFVKHDPRLNGYQIAPNQDLTPIARLAGSGAYPIYTVNMQANPVALHITYYNADTNKDVGSDRITQNNRGQSATTGDTINLPTVNHSIGLDNGYTLDGNQPSEYRIQSADSQVNGTAVKNIVMLAHGNNVAAEVPITVVNIDGNGKVQSRHVINVPVHGNVGDQITFNSRDFQGYLPQDYTLATQSNSYNHTNYDNQNYSATLMPSDVGTNQWHANSWQVTHDGKYWDNANSRPLVVIQAAGDKLIHVEFFNQNGQRVGLLPLTSSYHNSIDLKNPDQDHNSVLDGQIPNGYVYGANNPNSDTYGKDKNDVKINVTGRSETVNVEYDDPVTHRPVKGSVDDVVKGHQVGDVIELPVTHLPKGYHLIDQNDDNALKYTVNATDESRPGTIVRHLDVSPDTEVVPVKFINQNGAQIGGINYQTRGVIDQQNVALPMAPQGYHYDSAKSGNSYTFTPDQMANHPGFMQVHTVYLQGDSENVPVNFIDQNGQLVKNGTTSVSGQIGNVVNLPLAPKNETIDNDQPSQDTLKYEDIATSGQMKTVKIYVRTNQNYQFNVIAKEKVDGQITGKITTPVNINGSDNYEQTIKPSDYVPAGFKSEKGNQNVTTKVTDTGLTVPNVTWIYDAKSSVNNNDPIDNKAAQPILLTYIDADTGRPLMKNGRIDGETNQIIDLTNPNDGGIAVPKGYVIDTGQQVHYPIKTVPYPIKLKVHGAQLNSDRFNLNVARKFYKDPSDVKKGVLTTLTTPQSVLETGTVDSPFQIKASDYVPKGYHINPSSRNNQTVKGTVKSDGLSSINHTFDYLPGYSGSHQDGVQPINVTYYDDRTGTPEGTNVVNGYMDQMFNVGDLGTNGMKPGYTVDDNQTQTYTVGLQPTVAHVMVHGDASTNHDRDDQATINLYREDPYGNLLSDQPKTTHDVITGNVGDKYDVSANDYLPSGYQLDNSKNGDHDLIGTIQSDESIDHRDVDFYYQMIPSNKQNLKPIHVLYENSVNNTIIDDAVIMPSEKHDDYKGKFIDVVADNNPDNQQTPVPQGYDLNSNQDTQAAFSQKQPTYITVMVHANPKGTQYHDVFDRFARLYDGDQLMNSVVVPQVVKGVDGASYQIQAPAAPNGFTADGTNPTNVGGLIEKQHLTLDHAFYQYHATHSKPSDDGRAGYAQPILGTFKYGNQTIGQPNQRIDGYMNQSINILGHGHMQVPSDYHLVNPNADTTYRIGTQVQTPVIQVAPDFARNVTVAYEDQSDHDNIVAQRAINVVVNAKLGNIVDRYTNFVPYDYNYTGHVSWNSDMIAHDNDQYVVYVTKRHDRPQPQLSSDTNDGRIDVQYENAKGQILSSDVLFQPNETAFSVNKYTKTHNAGGLMPNDFSHPTIVSGNVPNNFQKGNYQSVVIKVEPQSVMAIAHVEYEDAKTHQLIYGISAPLSISITGTSGDAINYNHYQRFIPQGYSYAGMGSHDDVIEDGDVDMIMVRKDKPADNRIGTVRVTYYDDHSDKTLDTISVSGLDGQAFDLGYYENDLPQGDYQYEGVGNGSGITNFIGNQLQNVTIDVRKPQPVVNYGKIRIHFVKATSSVVSSQVNGNQDTSNEELAQAEVPGSYDEVMTGHVGDLFNPTLYEHNTPVNTTFDHIVKGNDVDAITSDPQDIWIAVQTVNGHY